MADTAKKEKIAAAKKKLKQFQKGRSGSPAPDRRSHENGNSTKANGDNTHISPPPTAKPSYANVAASLPTNMREVIPPPTRPSPTGSANTSAGLERSVYGTPVGGSTNHVEKYSESSERLQQLSRQINGLITQSESYITKQDENNEHSSLEDLENRNRQLAALLEQHMRANEQLSKQLQEMKSQNSRLNTSFEGEKKTYEDKLRREVGALKEQLQVHIQTIGILVAEKTELQSSVNQSQKVLTQKIEEIDELSGRLKASRKRVADLEKSYTDTSANAKKTEKVAKEYSKEVDRLKMELYRLNKSNEEFQQQNSELQGKLQKKVAETAKLEDSVLELKGKLEMAELYNQQLQNGGASNQSSSQQLEQLVLEKGELQARVQQYEEAFDKVSSERDQMTTQYNQYIERLTGQMQQLQQQISTLTEEKEKLARQQRDLEEAYEELRSKNESEEGTSAETEQQTEALRKRCGQLEDEIRNLQQQYQAQIADNSQLSRLVSEKEEKLMELELQLDKMSEESVDTASLLSSMQSDKTALSRAMAQNKELKTQLAELQNGFVKMSNENMDLMSQLQSEQHIARELANRLSQQEDELKEVREQLQQKEGLIKEIEAHELTEEHKAYFADQQIEDRIRHYEAQSQLVDTLQRELNSAQDTVNALTNQNTILQSKFAAQQESRNNNWEGDTRLEHMSSSLKQLEMERDQLMKQLEDERDHHQDVKAQLNNLQTELATQVPATLNGDLISKPQFEALQHAMKQLEGRYTKAMRDKADLSDKSEQLEHIIMQLQSETDTIGEYVSLYQQQRTLLKRRQEEKDDYISNLARDREELQDKLGQLQSLVMQLLGERQMLHSYHDSVNNLSPVANHTPHSTSPNQLPGASPKDSKFGTTLNSTNLEDWPDYDTSGSDSEVEPIVGEDGSVKTPERSRNRPHKSPHSSYSESTSSPVSEKDSTAQRIMHLLTELGSPHVVDRNLYNYLMDPERGLSILVQAKQTVVTGAPRKEPGHPEFYLDL